MGKLLYGGADMEIGFDDRALAHLQIVIGAKLRRGERFFFSWKDDISVGSGRSMIWLEPSIPLYFKFSGSKTVAINRSWLEALTTTANSSSGLTFLPEPGQAAAPTPMPQSRI